MQYWLKLNPKTILIHYNNKSRVLKDLKNQLINLTLSDFSTKTLIALKVAILKRLNVGSIFLFQFVGFIFKCFNLQINFWKRFFIWVLMYLTCLENTKLFNPTKNACLIYELFRVMNHRSAKKFYNVKWNNKAKNTWFEKLIFHAKQLS